MHPSQSFTLPCEENSPADETPEGIVIPFPGTYAAASDPGRGGQLTGDGTRPPAAALTGRSIGIEEIRAPSAEREPQLREITERWDRLKQARAEAVERELRIRALTERWHALRQAREQSAKRGSRVRARVAAFIAAILRVTAFRADDASFPSRSPCAKRS